jgi:sucrose-6-phosphate hydrolase SacC (GH32 family)
MELPGKMIFSGSAVVDVNNTSGLKTGASPPYVLIWTGHVFDEFGVVVEQN